jgi:carboxyl-terminal processing protease
MHYKKKFCFYVLFLLSGIVSAQQMFFDQNTIKMARVIYSINSLYVDSTNIDKLVEAGIVKMLKELDPHSTYVDKEEVKEMTESLEGNFEGIGVTFNVLQDTIYIISPISGGPSEKVGIMAGDRIIEIEGENVAGVGITGKGVRDRLLGEKDTKVEVGIKRKGIKELIYFTITRDKIPIYSRDAYYITHDSIGYIKLNRFSKNTIDEFLEAIDELQDLGMKHLILDLSGNGGGYLEIAFMLADQFLRSKQLIVYTEGLNSPRQDLYATGKGVFKKNKVVVMIDEGSASASEIVAGAVQDWDRGVIVGRRSFGKGLVQRPVELPDSSLIRLTVARYHTPTGRSIQKPYEEGIEAYSKDIINRYNSGELTSRDSAHFPIDEKYETLMNKRTVYGGGGIMPDYFVPLDTTKATVFYRNVVSKGLLNRFTLNYVDRNRKALQKKYPDFDMYDEKFQIDDTMFEEFLKLAEEEDVDVTDLEDIDESKEYIVMVFKAFIARDLFDNNAFYRVFNRDNDIYLKAVEILTTHNLYENKLLRQ